MQPDRIILSFNHLSGALIIITIEHTPPDRVQVHYSIRSPGIDEMLAAHWLHQWQDWIGETRKGNNPVLPPGWC